MIRKPYALLVRQRAQALSIAQLGLQCDAKEFPTVSGDTGPLTYWTGVAVFNGWALPYPLRGAGTVKDTVPLSATVVISRTAMYAILTPPYPDKPSLWLAAPIAQLNIGASAETSGIFKKKPIGVEFSTVEWQLTLGVTNQVEPATRRKSSSDALQMLAALGGPAGGRARRSQPGDRPMIALCRHGAPSPDIDSVPTFDEAGELILETGEEALWSGPASVVTTSAAAARGQEVFGTMWSSHDLAVQLVLTNRRLVYVIDTKAPQAGSIVPAPNSTVPTASPTAGNTVAGHVLHANVVTFITGDGDDYGAPGKARVTASVIDLLTTAIRVHVLVDPSDRGLADAWVRAVARLRTAAFPELELHAAEKWAQLAAQADAPHLTDGHWGRTAVIPFGCRIGEDLPR